MHSWLHSLQCVCSCTILLQMTAVKNICLLTKEWIKDIMNRVLTTYSIHKVYWSSDPHSRYYATNSCFLAMKWWFMKSMGSSNDQTVLFCSHSHWDETKLQPRKKTSKIYIPIVIMKSLNRCIQYATYLAWSASFNSCTAVILYGNDLNYFLTAVWADWMNNLVCWSNLHTNFLVCLEASPTEPFSWIFFTNASTVRWLSVPPCGKCLVKNVALPLCIFHCFYKQCSTRNNPLHTTPFYI